MITPSPLGFGFWLGLLTQLFDGLKYKRRIREGRPTANQDRDAARFDDLLLGRPGLKALLHVNRDAQGDQFLLFRRKSAIPSRCTSRTPTRKTGRMLIACATAAKDRAGPGGTAKRARDSWQR